MNVFGVFGQYLIYHVFHFQMIRDMKQQFSSLLREIGFLDSADPKAPAANQNSGFLIVQIFSWFSAIILFSSFLRIIAVYFILENLKLVKAVLCAGLYPNVARIEHHRTFRRYI